MNVSAPTKTGIKKDQISFRSELSAIAALLLMVAFFLAVSWRKWPDPLIDGYQWYTAWQISQGAILYQDLDLVYGPLSSYFNALLLKIFGNGMMVVITANLVIYGMVLALLYLVFRKAWGAIGAFTACAVFISVFSFSQLIQCGNFNFAAPYSHEILHGLLVIVIGTMIAARWSQKNSQFLALSFGLFAGLACVLKPEFILAFGFIGITVLCLRRLQKLSVYYSEGICFILGLSLPTAAFAAYFAQTLPWPTAFLNASHAWMIVFKKSTYHAHFQQNALGLNHPLQNFFFSFEFTVLAIAVIGCICILGKACNDSWSAKKRILTIICAAVLLYMAHIRGGWIGVGLSFPGLIGILLLFFIWRLVAEFRSHAAFSQKNVMALMLVLIAAAMLTRMALRARIYDFGFYQAALAGMVLSAFLTSDLPAAFKSGSTGERFVRRSSIALIAFACISIAFLSRSFRSAQTQPVADGRDRFYSFNSKIDTTGELVDWTIKILETTSPKSTVLVLPEGSLINYIARRRYPLRNWIPLTGGSSNDEAMSTVSRLRQSPPDYVVLISRPMLEYNISQFGSVGTPGHIILNWVTENYRKIASNGYDPFQSPSKKGALILQRISTDSVGNNNL